MLRLDRREISDLSDQLSRYKAGISPTWPSFAYFIRSLGEAEKAILRGRVTGEIEVNILEGVKDAQGNGYESLAIQAQGKEISRHMIAAMHGKPIILYDQLEDLSAAGCDRHYNFIKAYICRELFDVNGNIKPSILTAIKVDEISDEERKKLKIELMRSFGNEVIDRILGKAIFSEFDKLDGVDENRKDLMKEACENTFKSRLKNTWLKRICNTEKEIDKDDMAGLIHDIHQDDKPVIMNVDEIDFDLERKLFILKLDRIYGAYKVKACTINSDSNKSEKARRQDELERLTVRKLQTGLDLLDEMSKEIYLTDRSKLASVLFNINNHHSYPDGKIASSDIRENRALRRAVSKADEFVKSQEGELIFDNRFINELKESGAMSGARCNDQLKECVDNAFVRVKEDEEKNEKPEYMMDCIERSGYYLNDDDCLGMFIELNGVSVKEWTECDVDKFLKDNKCDCRGDCLSCRVKVEIKNEIAKEVVGESDAEACSILNKLEHEWRSKVILHEEDIITSQPSVQPTIDDAYRIYVKKRKKEIALKNIAKVVRSKITPDHVSKKFEETFGSEDGAGLLSSYSQGLVSDINGILGGAIEGSQDSKVLFLPQQNSFRANYSLINGEAVLRINIAKIGLFDRSCPDQSIGNLPSGLEVEYKLVKVDGDPRMKLSRIISNDDLILDMFRGRQFSDLELLEEYAPTSKFLKDNLYDLAKRELEVAIKEQPETALGKAAADVLKAVEATEETIEKQSKKSEDLVKVLRTTTALLKKPNSKKSQKASLDTIDAIVKYRGGKRIAGALMAFVGVAIMVTSIVIAAVSYGALSPVSVGGLKLGASMVAGGIAIGAGTAGLALGVSGIAGANTLFGSRKKAAVAKSAEQLLKATEKLPLRSAAPAA